MTWTTGLVGADPDELREVSTAVRRGQWNVEDAMSLATGSVRRLEWAGPDADRFRDRWDSHVLRDTRALVDGLHESASALDRHADAQELASTRRADAAPHRVTPLAGRRG